jgi:hypothetical protein
MMGTDRMMCQMMIDVDSVLFPIDPESSGPTDVDLRELDQGHTDHRNQFARKGATRIEEVVA